jgi:hypothetical protein
MNLATLLVLGCLLALVIAWVAIVCLTNRSLFVLVLGSGFVVLASGLAYYAFVESQSLSWGLGYSAAAVGVALATAINWLPRKSPSAE